MTPPMFFITTFVTLFALVIAITKDLPDVEGDRKGDPKCWYNVPGSEASAFEKVMKNSLPDLFDAQPDLLFQLVTMLNPSVLQENGVPVYIVLQEPGNFVITFPRSYHGGFNFAPADRLPHGGFGAELYKRYHKAAMLSHDTMLA